MSIKHKTVTLTDAASELNDDQEQRIQACQEAIWAAMKEFEVAALVEEREDTASEEFIPYRLVLYPNEVLIFELMEEYYEDDDTDGERVVH